MAEIGNHPRQANPMWWELDAATRPEGALAMPPTNGNTEAALGSHAFCNH
jgi:hypothetical protein